MQALDYRLLNDFQRDFPLVPEPYSEIAARAGCAPAEVTARLAALKQQGKVSRIGATYRPGAFGASTLAAMRVPAQRLEETARIVGAFPEVNHNYQRDHDINLWFVVNARDAASLDAVIAHIERQCALPVIRLPLLAEYHIDLGFDLAGSGRRTAAVARPPACALALGAAERALLASLQAGLALAERPYAALAGQCGMTQEQAIAVLRHWLALGALRRLGVIVRHRELGFTENAMVVWDVPDAQADEAGIAVAGSPAVTLCYRRRRTPGAWPYNLYCMIHGDDRARVLREIDAISRACGLEPYPHQVLFGVRRFKQQGASHAGAR